MCNFVISGDFDHCKSRPIDFIKYSTRKFFLLASHENFVRLETSVNNVFKSVDFDHLPLDDYNLVTHLRADDCSIQISV